MWHLTPKQIAERFLARDNKLIDADDMEDLAADFVEDELGRFDCRANWKKFKQRANWRYVLEEWLKIRIPFEIDFVSSVRDLAYAVEEHLARKGQWK